MRWIRERMEARTPNSLLPEGELGGTVATTARCNHSEYSHRRLLCMRRSSTSPDPRPPKLVTCFWTWRPPDLGCAFPPHRTYIQMSYYGTVTRRTLQQLRSACRPATPVSESHPLGVFPFGNSPLVTTIKM